MAEVRLIMFKSDGSRRDFPLKKNNVVIGRTSEVDLRIPLSSVSRRHCEVFLDGEAVKMRDLGSSNGTFHNSVRVQEATLAAGDQIEIGPVVFIVTVNGKPENVAPVRSMVESDPVDTSVGVAALDDTPEDEAPPAAAAAAAPPAKPATVIKPTEKPKPIPAMEDQDMPTRIDPEMDSPTVDLDDPISALERLATEQRKADEASFFEAKSAPGPGKKGSKSK